MTNNKVNQSIELERIEEARLEQRGQKLIAHIEANYLNKKTRPCVGLVWEITGASPHMAVDEIREMKSSFMDILAFLADPEIAKKFEDARDGNYFSRHFAKHIKRVINFLDDANDKQVFAELAHFDLKEFGHDEKDLESFERDFY